MAKQLSREEFVRNLTDCGLFSPEELNAILTAQPDLAKVDGEQLAKRLVEADKLTPFQAAAVRDGRFDDLTIGRYRVLDRLGAGGMGTVYKAQHLRMKRIVAIKVLLRSVGQSEIWVHRFQREVEAVARLSHPNIVAAYDADEAEIGHFLVMEFVDGPDLASIVDERGPLPVAEAVDYIIQAAQAMDYAHRQGIVHRDIKPANLLRDQSGIVKVTDLGLARFNDALGKRSDEKSALTQAGSIMGTIDFMSPEQALGLTEIDHRADIYSLGCTLYFLLTGRPPFQGPTLMAILMKHREGAIPSLCADRAETPIAVDQVFRRMMAKKPEDRYASMSEVIRAFKPIALAAAPVPPPATPRAAGPVTAPTPTVDFLPADQDTDSGSAVKPIGAAAESTTPGTAGISILLVEPSRSQAVIIRSLLHKLGHQEVPTAPTGQKALDLVSEVVPRVVIASMHLSDMTGLQLAQKMQAQKASSSTGFILISSQADSQPVDLGSQTGTIISLHKPFDQEGLARALARALGRSLGAGDVATGRAAVALRVLVVDDSAAARRHIHSVLAGLGVSRIVEAADGAEALTLLGQGAFDLVVTDYNMPYLDGRALVDFIRHRSAVPSVPIIVVTTETDTGKLEAIHQLGVTAICDKSFKPEVVRELLNHLDGSNQRAELGSRT